MLAFIHIKSQNFIEDENAFLIKVMCIFHKTFNKGVQMDMSLYTAMSSIQIHVYYLIINNLLILIN